MVEIVAHVKSKYGIHARPAAAISNEARRFYDTKIILINPDKRDTELNAKDLLAVLSINRKCGDPIIIRAYGKDEQIAVDSIAKVIEEFEVSD